MISKAWSLRYALMRAQMGLEETVTHLTSSTGSLSDAIAKGLEVYRKELTKTIFFTDGTSWWADKEDVPPFGSEANLHRAAMAPTLNSKANSLGSGDSAVDRLLMRCLPRASLRTVFSGDVVAFNSPLASGSGSENIMVRRVAAVEGDELITDDPADASYTIPEGRCWVLADNEELKPPEVIDSRTFGPLPVENIVGRIVYYMRPNDHGVVENSKPAMAADAAVLEAELDLEKLRES